MERVERWRVERVGMVVVGGEGGEGGEGEGGGEGGGADLRRGEQPAHCRLYARDVAVARGEGVRHV